MANQHWLLAGWMAVAAVHCGTAGPSAADVAAGDSGAAASFDAKLGETTAVPATQPWHASGQVPAGCQQLAAEWDCMLPWPSDWYRQTQGGKAALVVPPEAAPQQVGDDGKTPKQPIDFSAAFPQDGFGVLGQIAVKLPGGAGAAGLVPAYVGGKVNPDFSPSQSPQNLTLLIDADSRQAIAHFAEPDALPEPKERFLMLRPVQRLQEGHRYIVALQAGLVASDGAAIEAPKTFAALRDKAPQTAADALRPHYEADVFPALAAFGVQRSKLLLAWDFTTRSEANATADMLAIRSQMMETLAKLPLEATITQVLANPKPHIARQFEGTLQVPLFVQNEFAGAKLVRDAAGHVTQNGFAKVPFTLVVPPNVWEGKAGQPARVVQYGHGFFGARDEVVKGVLPELLERMGAVGMGVDWWGMSFGDAAILVTDLINQPSEAVRFIERVHQGMANQLALTWAAKHGLWALPPLVPADKALTEGKDVYFYGLSQGHILGATQVALNPWIDRAALGVGGAGFGLMMSRAAPFATFLNLLTSTTGTPQGATRATLLLTAPLERIDPGTYGPHLRTNTYAGGPAQRHILQHCGLSDTQVPNLASHLFARIISVPVLQPGPRTVWGLPNVSAPTADALVEFDFSKPALDTAGPAPDGGNPVHDAQRYLLPSQQQIDQFFKPDGLVNATCSGVCDPD